MAESLADKVESLHKMVTELLSLVRETRQEMDRIRGSQLRGEHERRTQRSLGGRR